MGYLILPGTILGIIMCYGKLGRIEITAATKARVFNKKKHNVLWAHKPSKFK